MIMCQSIPSLTAPPPPGQTPGEFFVRANPYLSGTKKVRNSEPCMGQQNRAKTPPPGQLFSNIQQKTTKRE